MTRVVLIEDQPLFAEVVRSVLIKAGLEVAATCSTGEEGLRAVRRLDPDLVLVDLSLPDRHGLDVGRQILKKPSRIKVVALTVHDDPRTVRQAMKAGFAGYLTKDTSTDGFVSALKAIIDGEGVFRQRLPRRRRPSLPEREDAALLASQLTEREREVLSLLARGATGREIAEALTVSLNTVRSHVQKILMKLQVHSRLEAVAFALQHGLVERGQPPDQEWAAGR
jgi:two-component system nitrate/nitrite response regulator NarL